MKQTKPTQPEDFLGKTRLHARALFQTIPALQQGLIDDAQDRCMLFIGPRGCGKTSLADAFASALTGGTVATIKTNPSVERINGVLCGVDTVSRWMATDCYAPMFSTVNVKYVDDLEGASRDAFKGLRYFLQDMSPHTVFIATTNWDEDKLPEQIASRCKLYYFEKVPANDIAHWLVAKFNIALEQARRFADCADGDVRAAKGKTLAYLQALAAL